MLAAADHSGVIVMRKAMASLSVNLLGACRSYAFTAQNSNDADEVANASVACIFIAPSVIEALFNEFISANETGFDKDINIPKEVFTALRDKQMIHFEKRWNIISAILGGEKWDNRKQPFKSYKSIKSVRNSFVHYGGEYLEYGDAPSRCVRELSKRFAIEEIDDTDWTTNLCLNKEFAPWVYFNIRNFFESVPKLLNASKSQYLFSIISFPLLLEKFQDIDEEAIKEMLSSTDDPELRERIKFFANIDD